MASNQDVQRIIGEQLRDMNLSMRAAEDVAGLKRDAIRNILRGCSPTYRNLVKICDALELNITITRRDRRPFEAPPADTTDRPTKAVTQRQAAKDALYKVFLESETSDEVVTALRAVRTDVIAEVMDEMIQAHREEQADELANMAAEAGHKIW